MFPLLMIASRLAPILKSVSGSGLSLKGKTKETTTQSSAEKQADEVETVLDKDGKEHAADSPKGKMIINMTKEEEAPEEEAAPAAAHGALWITSGFLVSVRLSV